MVAPRIEDCYQWETVLNNPTSTLVLIYALKKLKRGTDQSKLLLLQSQIENYVSNEIKSANWSDEFKKEYLSLVPYYFDLVR